MHFFCLLPHDLMLEGRYSDETFIHISFLLFVAHLGPPILTTHTTFSALRIRVTLPRGPKGVSVAEIMTNSKRAIFKTVPKYILNITHPEWVAQVSTHLSSLTKYTVHIICYNRNLHS